MNISGGVQALAILRQPRDREPVGGRHEDQGGGDPRQHRVPALQAS